jgi:phycocyanobilin:ferredoxin oxidoreductase
MVDVVEEEDYQCVTQLLSRSCPRCGHVVLDLARQLEMRSHALQVLHVVMWPRREYDMPIFGADVVVAADKVVYVIADTTPVNAERRLPQLFSEAVTMLQSEFMGGFEHVEVPDWGKELFSEQIAAVRPELPAEADLCCMYIVALMRIHILHSKFADTWVGPEDQSRLEALDAGHRRYETCRCIMLEASL